MSFPGRITIQKNHELYQAIDGLLDFHLDVEPNQSARFFLFRDLIKSLADIIDSDFLNVPAFYLPADRAGVMQSHKVVVGALIKNATMTGLRPDVQTPMLSGVLADFLERLIEMDDPTNQHSSSREHGARIEQAILGGSVRIKRSESTNYPRFAYRPNGWEDDLPLINASSMVLELAPVVLFLRHWIRDGNVLIVEEPESHLHPAMQVEFTRQLALLVQAGIRVIITTHSEWVLEELGNIVQRATLPKKQREDLSGGGIALHSDQVGIWLFKKKPSVQGSVVEEVEMDRETGLYPVGFDAVSEELYNDNANIFNRIQGSSNQ